MPTSIKENVSSDYSDFSNSLRPKSKPKQVEVYVESEDDIAFWRTILHPYENNKLKFSINLPSHTSLAKGKNKALARENDIFELVTGQLGKFLLICVDSDYDYLLHDYYESIEKQAVARKISENNYVFQTYTYAIENLKCYAESLHTVCVAATFNDEQKIDFEEFMKIYSSIIYGLFLWNLLFYSKGEDNHFTLTQFCNAIKILGANDMNETLKKLEENVKQNINKLETNFPHYKTEVLAFGSKLKLLGLNQDNTYLFVQGHTILDNVVLELLKPLCNLLRNENRAKIKAKAKNKTEENDELNHYQDKVKNLKVETILSANTEFKACFLFSKIQQDIDTYIIDLQ